MSVDPHRYANTAVADISIGRPVVEHAREIEVHPSAIVRWIRRGYRLSDGVREYLKTTALPGGYRVRDEDLATFLDKITQDKLGRTTAATPAVRTPAQARRAHVRAEAELRAERLL
jgi:hypothetical protein